MRRLAILAALAILLSGCASVGSGPTFRLSGSFTAERTQADLDEFHAIVRPYSDDVAILESFPEQFVIRSITGGCDQLRATLQSKDYIASVGTCQRDEPASGDPDAATSSP